jgi:hypothetical protein
MDLLPWHSHQVSPSRVRTGQKSPQGWTRTKLWHRGFCIERQWRVCSVIPGHTSLSLMAQVSSFRTLLASSLSSSHQSQLWQQQAAPVAW